MSIKARATQELDYLNKWLPSEVDPGTVYIPRDTSFLGETENPGNPRVGIFSCPTCRLVTPIKRTQYAGLESIICETHDCSSEYYFRNGELVRRIPQ